MQLPIEKLIETLKILSQRWLSIFVFCHCVLVSCAVSANVFNPAFNEIKFHNYNPEEIDLHPVINAIAQDHDGFMWFGTQDGLARFDGKNLKHFNVTPDQTNSLVNNWIYDIHVDQSNQIWIATKGGVNVYNPAQESFISLTNQLGEPLLPAINFENIAETENGDIWLSSQNVGIYRVKPSLKKVTLFDQDSNSSLETRKIWHIAAKNNDLYVATEDKGLLKFVYDKNEFKQIETHSTIVAISRIYISDSDELWAISKDVGASLLDLKTGYFRVFNSSFCANQAKDILKDSRGFFWFATDTGLCGYDPVNDVEKVYNATDVNVNSLINDVTERLYEDKGGVVWVGTLYGISTWNVNRKQITHLSSKIGNVILGDTVTSFAYDSATEFHYIGSFDGGVSQIHTSTNTIKHFTSDNFPSSKLPRIMSLRVDSQSNLWMGTFESGLFKFSKDMTFIRHYQVDSNEYSISSNAISKIIELKDKRIAIATFGGGVNILESNQPSKIFNTKSTPAISSVDVVDIVEDSSGNLWVAMLNGGLAIIQDKINNVRTLSDLLPEQQKRLDHNIFSLHDDDEYIWLGTQEKGLLKLKKESFFENELDLDVFDTTDGLLSNSIYGIVPTEDNVWFSHGRGLASVNKYNNTIVNYDASYGLQGRDFISGAFFKDDIGQIFFGGSNGFNVFKESSFTDSSYRAPLVLVHHQKSELAIPLNSMFNQDGVVDIDYNQGYFSFDVALLDYSKPEKNQYMYKIDEISSSFIDIETNSRIAFSSLPIGEYTLTIMGMNSDGVASKDTLNIPLKINPPFWKSTLAYFVYAVIAVVLVLLSYIFIRQKIHAQIKFQQELQYRVDQRTQELNAANLQLSDAMQQKEQALIEAKQATKAKSDFIATMSHEIRTPMNSILGMGELLLNTSLEKQQRRYAQNVYNAGKMLLGLINNVLDFSKIEISKMHIEAIPLDFRALVEETATMFSSKAKEGGNEFDLYVDYMMPTALIGDPTRIRQIIINLLGNAFKFTSNGHVYLSATYSKARLIIEVKDSGIGMNEEQLSRIFNAFEQADSGTTRKFGGTGLGLAITKSLIDLMHGQVKVRSKEGGGTTFTVSLPLKQGKTTDTLDSSVLTPVTNVYVFIDKNNAYSSLTQILKKLSICYSDDEQVFNKDDNPCLILIEPSYLKKFTLAHQNKLKNCQFIVIGQGTVELYDNLNIKVNIRAYLERPILLNDVYDCICEDQELKLNSGTNNALAFGETNKIHADILVVDDSIANQEVASSILTMLGANAELAENGEIALKMAMNKRYDLIFMDCHMPIMDGYTATQYIRQHQISVQELPSKIIALTAGSGESYRSECLKAGMDDFMVKPFSGEQMLKTLKKHVPEYIQSNLDSLSSNESDKFNDANSGLKICEQNTEAHEFNLELINTVAISTLLDIERELNKPLYTVVFDTLKSDIKNKLPDMQAATTNKELANIAHALKSVSGNAGAVGLVNLLNDIETLEDLTQKDVILSKLNQIAELTFTEIVSFLESEEYV